MYDFSSIAREDLPAPAARFSGLPQFNFVGGHLAPESIPVEKLIEASKKVLIEKGSLLATYSVESGPQGYLGLREYLVRKLEKYSSISCHTDDLLLTSGSSQGMDLINWALLERGDTVIVEESNYGGAFSRLVKLGVNRVAIPVDENGMQTDVLARELELLAARSIKPKYIYTIPTVHNPTGTIMSLQRREHLLELASKYDIAVYEDECYADLVWAGTRPPSLYALDKESRVVHIGTFSKTVAPALRVGYILANWSLLSRLLSLKTDAGSGSLEQMMLAEFCEAHFDKHLSDLNKLLQKKLDTLVAAIDREFGTAASYEYPPGGIYLWLKLPEVVDTTVLAQVALDSGIAINPGSEWSMQSDSLRHLRLCFAKPAHSEIDSGVEALAKVCFEKFGIPEFGSNKTRT